MPEKSYSTLLFDLDGTLLDVQMSAFMDDYFVLLARRFTAGKNLSRFTRKIIAAAQAMFSNRNGDRKLDRVFLDSLAAKVGLPEGEVQSALRDFYRQEFNNLRHLTLPVPEARPLLEQALRQGYDLVLATNPVFTLEAIRARLSWAGLTGIPFRFITSAEVMHFCKPHREYFAELLQYLDRKAGECLMIGNDAEMDLAAARLGIATYYVFHRENPVTTPPGADHAGTLEDLAEWLIKLGSSAGRS